METKEIFANDKEELERQVKIEEDSGWTRRGEVEVVHPPEPGIDEKVGTMSFLQIMTKDNHEVDTPQ